MELWQVFVPAYTFKNTDCQQKRISVLRTTMEGVNKISERISRLEEYTTLSFAESELLGTNIIDAATGLDKFKTGYIVENLQNPTVLGDVRKSYYNATFNSVFGIMPKLEETNLQVVVDITGGVVNTGGVLTLPYTEEVFAEVKVSSRVTNLNPFLIVSWVGEMVLTPPSDNWTEVVDLPDVVVEKEVIQEVITWIFIPPAPPPPSSVPVFGPTSAGPGNGPIFGPADTNASRGLNSSGRVDALGIFRPTATYQLTEGEQQGLRDIGWSEGAIPMGYVNGIPTYNTRAFESEEGMQAAIAWTRAF